MIPNRKINDLPIKGKFLISDIGTPYITYFEEGCDWTTSIIFLHPTYSSKNLRYLEGKEVLFNIDLVEYINEFKKYAVLATDPLDLERNGTEAFMNSKTEVSSLKTFNNGYVEGFIKGMELFEKSPEIRNTWREVLLKAEWEKGLKVPEDLIEYLEENYQYPVALKSK